MYIKTYPTYILTPIKYTCTHLPIYIYLCLYMYISSNMHSIYVYYYACVGIKYEYYI